MTRAVTPVLGVVVLAALTVILAAVIGVATVSTAPPPDPPSPFALSADVDASTGRITLAHDSPTPLDVRELAIRISVDGERLEHQPSVPFFSATGFAPGPTGPFNVASDPVWERDERASLRVAKTSNVPVIDVGSTVRVEIYRDGLPVASTETRAR